MSNAPMPDSATLPEALAAILAQDIAMTNGLARYASELQRLSPEIARAYETLVARLRAVNTGQNAPDVGDHLPEFVLTDQEGRLRTLRDFTARGPVIVSINRGHWCPFCQIELGALTRSAETITRHGASILSIMPETQPYTKIVSARGVPFPVLSDIDGAYALELGLCFYIGDELVDILRQSGYQIPAFQGNDSWFLPVPATFVIDAEGIIRARYVDPDFRLNRMTIDTIVSSLADVGTG